MGINVLFQNLWVLSVLCALDIIIAVIEHIEHQLHQIVLHPFATDVELFFAFIRLLPGHHAPEIAPIEAFFVIPMHGK